MVGKDYEIGKKLNWNFFLIKRGGSMKTINKISRLLQASGWVLRAITFFNWRQNAVLLIKNIKYLR